MCSGVFFLLHPLQKTGREQTADQMNSQTCQDTQTVEDTDYSNILLVVLVGAQQNQQADTGVGEQPREQSAGSKDAAEIG